MSDPHHGRVKAGDEVDWDADEWNETAKALEALSRLTVASPLAMTGRTLRDTTPRGWWGLLAGAGPTYSATEQVRVGGAWVAGAASTASAIEVNAKTGLAGKRVWLTACDVGSYCFQFVRRGGTCNGQICFIVTTTTGGIAIVGATVTVYDGPTNASPVLGTCTTDPYGVCCIPITVAKTYAWKVEKATYSTVTGTVAATCTTNNVAVQLVPPTVRCPLCASDLTNTLYVTDPSDGVAVAVTNTGTSGGWYGCRIISATNVRDASCTTPMTRMIAVGYTLSCLQTAVGAHKFTLAISWFNCAAVGLSDLKASDCTMPPRYGGSNTNSVSNYDNSGPTCSPVAATFTLDFNSGLTPEAIPIWGNTATFTASA